MKNRSVEWPADFEGPDDQAVVDKPGLAALTGLTITQIEVHMKAGMPVHSRKRGTVTTFSVPDVVQWLIASIDDPLDAAKTRQAEAIARKREAEAKKMDGAMVDIELVVATIKDHVAKLQSEFELIPAKCPTDAEIVRNEIRGAINRFASGVAP